MSVVALWSVKGRVSRYSLADRTERAFVSVMNCMLLCNKKKKKKKTDISPVHLGFVVVVVKQTAQHYSYSQALFPRRMWVTIRHCLGKSPPMTTACFKVVDMMMPRTRSS